MKRISSWFQRRWRRRCSFGGVRKTTHRRARRVFFEPLEDRRVLATITVTSLADNMNVDGQVTLREAIEAANTDTSVDGSVAGDSGTFGGLPDDIVFAPELTGTIDLNGTELTVIGAGVNITGPGPDLLTIDAHHNSRVFHANSVRFSIDGLTLTGGQSTGNGGAILSDSGGSVEIQNSEIHHNAAADGGGIYWVWGGVGSAFTVSNSTIRNNSATDGGGIYADGSFMQLTTSTVADNDASGSGGGIHGGVIGTQSTISGNTAGMNGGGIQTAGALGHVNLQNSTVSGNVAGSSGGAIGVEPGFTGYVRVNWSTIAGNEVTATDGRGGGIYLVPAGSTPGGDYALLTLQSSIIGGNSADDGPDLNVPEVLNGVGRSLIGSNAGTSLVAAPVGAPSINGNLIGEPGAIIDPLIAPLANNGGTTQTHALLPDSPAIDASYDPIFAELVGVPSEDQRGFPRLENDLDMGAFELTQPLNFFDDGTFALWANNPLGFVESPVSLFHNGSAVGAQPYQAVELFHQAPGTSSYPLVFADLVGNTFSRLAYLRADGASVPFGTSTVGTASFRTGDGLFHYVPQVSRADVSTGGSNGYQSVVSGNFGGLAGLTSTKSFLTPTVGQTASTVAVRFNALQDIALATGSRFRNNDRLRLFTASSMFNDEANFDADVLRYENAAGDIKTLVLSDQTPTDAFLFPSAFEIGSWFELVKTGGSAWFPDSPSTRITIDNKHGLRLGLQGFLQQSVDNNDDSLSVWLEWLDAPDTVTAGTTLGLDVTVTAMAPGTAGIIVSESNSETFVSEAATTDTFDVALAAQPRSDVLIEISSGDPDEATVDKSMLTFTPANWDQPQTVTVTGIDDMAVDGNQVTTITVSVDAANSDDAFDQLDDQTVSVITIDEDVLLDFGDSPTAAQSGFANSYPVTLAQNGARHAPGELFLGAIVDVELDGAPDDRAGQASSGGDDNDHDADEDGVLATATIVASMSAETRSSLAITSSQTGKVDAWIDFNRDGDWFDAGEQIFASEPVQAGVNLLSFTVPVGASPGETFARFRLSSAGALTPLGFASDGEVEDHLVTIVDGNSSAGVVGEIRPPAAGTLNVVADGGDVVVRDDAIELFRAPGASLGQIEIVGTDGDDTLNLADLEPIFTGIVGGNAGAGDDTLRLTGEGNHLDLTTIPGGMLRNIEVIDLRGDGANHLILDQQTFYNVTDARESLQVLSDSGDSIDVGAGWQLEDPVFIDGVFFRRLAGGTLLLHGPSHWQNPVLAQDIDGDGNAFPLDVLILINAINSGVSMLPAPSPANMPPYYYDPTGDGSLFPLDVLNVINYVNAHSTQSGGGEGEVATKAIRPLAAIPRPSTHSIAVQYDSPRAAINLVADADSNDLVPYQIKSGSYGPERAVARDRRVWDDDDEPWLDDWLVDVLATDLVNAWR